MAYKDVTPPAGGKISIKAGKLTVPENPIVPFIRGDGTGPDIWAASVRVFDAAVAKAYYYFLVSSFFSSSLLILFLSEGINGKDFL